MLLALAIGLNLLAILLLGALLVMHLIERRPNMFDVEDGHPVHQLGCGWMDCAVCNPDKEE